MKNLYPLRNPIREYAWGSKTAISELLGRPASDVPQAELWLGAHPSAPSELDDGGVWQPLDRWAAEHREELLGPQVAGRWPHLPFLLKILAADKPLSIQAHPDAQQAESGFAAEEAAGVPRDARERNYPDNRHKPELIFALTPFSVLRGFREPGDVRRRFEAVGLASASCLAPLDEGAESSLRAFLLKWLDASADEAGQWVQTALATLEGRGPRDESEAWLPRLAEEYGFDRGVLGPLFLHVFTLDPGEALYTGAGVLHAYLGGLGIEVMASSDNVLRGGLTVKHVDPEELGKVVRCVPQTAERTEGVTHPGELRFDTPADEFRLSVLRPGGGVVDAAGGVQILLCTEGEGAIHVGDETTPIRRGESLLVPHRTGPFRLSGQATVFRATVGI